MDGLEEDGCAAFDRSLLLHVVDQSEDVDCVEKFGGEANRGHVRLMEAVGAMTLALSRQRVVTDRVLGRAQRRTISTARQSEAQKYCYTATLR